ncbi:hypothetical protein BGZ94_010312 [Podila epigama]|nr:hypothetical protein BGZ94_010312 [Podila epigama]
MDATVAAAMDSYTMKGWTTLMRNQEATSQVCVNCEINPPVDSEDDEAAHTREQQEQPQPQPQSQSQSQPQQQQQHHDTKGSLEPPSKHTSSRTSFIDLGPLPPSSHLTTLPLIPPPGPARPLLHGTGVGNRSSLLDPVMDGVKKIYRWPSGRIIGTTGPGTGPFPPPGPTSPTALDASRPMPPPPRPSTPLSNSPKILLSPRVSNGHGPASSPSHPQPVSLLSPPPSRTATPARLSKEKSRLSQNTAVVVPGGILPPASPLPSKLAMSTSTSMASSTTTETLPSSHPNRTSLPTPPTSSTLPSAEYLSYHSGPFATASDEAMVMTAETTESDKSRDMTATAALHHARDTRSTTLHHDDGINVGALKALDSELELHDSRTGAIPHEQRVLHRHLLYSNDDNDDEDDGDDDDDDDEEERGEDDEEYGLESHDEVFLDAEEEMYQRPISVISTLSLSAMTTSSATVTPTSTETITSTATTPTTPTTTMTMPLSAEELRVQEQRREQNERATRLIGQKMLQGWALLQDPCPNPGCNGVLLLQSPDKRDFCVVCDKYLDDDACGNNSTATTRSTKRNSPSFALSSSFTFNHTLISSSTFSFPSPPSTLPPTPNPAPAPAPTSPIAASFSRPNYSSTTTHTAAMSPPSYPSHLRGTSPISSPSQGRATREAYGRVSGSVILPPQSTPMSPSLGMTSQQILNRSEDVDKFMSEDDEPRRHVSLISRVNEFSAKSLPPAPTVPAPRSTTSSRPGSTYSNSSSGHGESHHQQQQHQQQNSRHMSKERSHRNQHQHTHSNATSVSGSFPSPSPAWPQPTPVSPEVQAVVEATHKTIGTLVVKVEVYRQALEASVNPKECQALTAQIKGLMECLKACRDTLDASSIGQSHPHHQPLQHHIHHTTPFSPPFSPTAACSSLPSLPSLPFPPIPQPPQTPAPNSKHASKSHPIQLSSPPPLPLPQVPARSA